MLLDENTFFLYAAKHYDNPECYDINEFQEDLNRFKYIKRLFSKYHEKQELNERLILNHLIILYNVFGPTATTKMLFYKLFEYSHYLKPFLLLLDYMPDKIIDHTGKIIHSSDIIADQGIVDTLRKI